VVERKLVIGDLHPLVRRPLRRGRCRRRPGRAGGPGRAHLQAAPGAGRRDVAAGGPTRRVGGEVRPVEHHVRERPRPCWTPARCRGGEGVGPYALLPEGVGGEPERAGEGVRPTARRSVGVGDEFPLRRTQRCCLACARE
jgi:hypothetical protein